MSRNISKNMLSFLGGAGLGALVMYLLDPESGEERRGSAAHQLRRTGETISDALSSGWHTVGEKLGEYGRAAGTGASSIAAMVAERASALGEGASSGAAGLRKHGRRAMKHLRGHAHGVSKRIKSAAGYRESSPWVRGLLAVGFVAVGAGAMFMLDPDAGRRRRALARDKMRSGIGRTSRAVSSAGRHVWNRTSGAAAELRGRLRRRAASDSTIEERIRSELGHCVSNPQALTVSSVGGCVTISGTVRAEEFDPLLKCIWGTSGVVDLINQLQVEEHAGVTAPGGEY